MASTTLADRIGRRQPLIDGCRHTLEYSQSLLRLLQVLALGTYGNGWCVYIGHLFNLPLRHGGLSVERQVSIFCSSALAAIKYISNLWKQASVFALAKEGQNPMNQASKHRIHTAVS